MDNEIRTIGQSDGSEATRLTLDYNIKRVRVDHADDRVYIAGEDGDIEYYDFKDTTDNVKDTRHIVISQIHASDFVVDFCYK